jgi:hypothetical protein
MRTAVWSTAPRLPSGLRLRSAKSRRCGCRAADCLGMVPLRQQLTLPLSVDILLIGRIYIHSSTRSPVDCASELSSASYQSKSAVQVVFSIGIGPVMATNGAFPLEEISHRSKLKQREQMQLFRQEKLLRLELNGTWHGKSALRKAALLGCGESAVFVKAIQVTAV